jgi:hypothetical protein
MTQLVSDQVAFDGTEDLDRSAYGSLLKWAGRIPKLHLSYSSNGLKTRNDRGTSQPCLQIHITRKGNGIMENFSRSFTTNENN